MALSLEQERIIAIARARKRKAESEKSTANPDFFGSGFIEPARAVASGLKQDVIGGLSGIANTLDPSAPQGAGAQAVQEAQSQAFTPKTPSGKEGMLVLRDLVNNSAEIANMSLSGLGGLAKLISGQGAEEASKTIKDIQEKGISKALGDIGFDATGSPLVGAALETLPTAVTSIPLGRILGKSADSAAIKALNRGIVEDLKNAPTDSQLSKFVLSGLNQVEKNTLGRSALKQKISPTVIGVAIAGDNVDKLATKNMVRIISKSKDNGRFADANKPFDVVGKTLKDRLDTVIAINKKAGFEVGEQAKALKGKVYLGNIKSKFRARIVDRGIGINEKGRFDFKDADINEKTAPANLLEEVSKVLDGIPDNMNARGVHRLKKRLRSLIDSNNEGRGATGEAEFDVKGVIKDINDSLNTQFPKYAKPNNEFSQTIKAIDDFKKVTGVDPKRPSTAKFLGAAARTLTSKSKSNPKLTDSINQLTEAANVKNIKFKGDIPSQVAVAKRLEEQFYKQTEEGNVPSIKEVTEATAGSQFVKAKGVVEIGSKIVKATRRINDENALKVLEKLTRQKTKIPKRNK